MKLKPIHQRGDTIIEVMLAMAVLSLLLFTAWGATNRASQTSFAARQRVDMVSQLKEQAEVLKSERTAAGMGGSFAEKFQAITDVAPEVNPCATFSESSPIGTEASQPPHSFHYGVSSGSVVRLSGSKLVRDNVHARVWIQKQTQPGYIDFYVQGCWLLPGGSNDRFDSSLLIVRLNT